MKKHLLIPLGVLVLTVLGNCSSRDLDELQPISVDPIEDDVTFQDVRFVFDNICTQCHSNPPQNDAPMPLVTYLQVVDAVENRGLLDRISRAEGESGLMPLGGPRLPQANIDLIFEWNNDGLIEN